MLLEEDARHNLFFKKKIPARTTQSLNWSYKKAQSALASKKKETKPSTVPTKKLLVAGGSIVKKAIPQDDDDDAHIFIFF